MAIGLLQDPQFQMARRSITGALFYDGSSAQRATTPAYLRSQGITQNGTYWIKAANAGGIGQNAAVQAYIYFNYFDSKDWVLVMDLNQTSTTSGTLITTFTPQDCVGYSMPWNGICLRVNGTNYYAYLATSSTYAAYDIRSDTTTLTGGNYNGYRFFIGQAGGQGWYNTGQLPCNWPSGSGSIGAGYDGSCGSYPTGLRMGTGSGGGPSYSLVTGTYQTLIYMGNAQPNANV